MRDSLNARPADLAIVDSQIGTMGGIAVALDLRLEADAGRLEPCPVLLVLDRRPDVFMARRSGAEGWILKPLDPIRLGKAVARPARRRHLARHQLPARPGRRAVPLMREPDAGGRPVSGRAAAVDGPTGGPGGGEPPAHRGPQRHA